MVDRLENEKVKLKENINPDINVNIHKSSAELTSNLRLPLKQSGSENGCSLGVAGSQPLNSIETANNINMLNDDMLLHVFSLLPRKTICRCLQVCRRWSTVAEHPSLWKKVDLSHRLVSLKLVLKLIRRQVVIMKLSSSEIVDDARDMYFVKNISYNLQLLDLSMSTIPVHALNAILKSTTSLKKLSLENCEVDLESLTFISKNKQLDTLNLAMCNGVKGIGLSKIFKGCKRLQNLNNSWTGLTEECINTMCDSLPARITRWNLSGCCNSLKDKHIAVIVSRCRDLMELDISDSFKVSLEGILMLRNLPRLTRLSISRCYILTKEKLEQLPPVKQLLAFDILSKETLEFLEKKHPGMQINKQYFSTVARPTVGIRRTSIWTVSVRDND